MTGHASTSETIPMLRCLWCGAPFKPYHSRHFYCKTAHRKLSHRRKSRAIDELLRRFYRPSTIIRINNAAAATAASDGRDDVSVMEALVYELGFQYDYVRRNFIKRGLE